MTQFCSDGPGPGPSTAEQRLFFEKKWEGGGGDFFLKRFSGAKRFFSRKKGAKTFFGKKGAKFFRKGERSFFPTKKREGVEMD